MQDFCILESVTVYFVDGYQHLRLTCYLRLRFPESVGGIVF